MGGTEELESLITKDDGTLMRGDEFRDFKQIQYLPEQDQRQVWEEKFKDLGVAWDEFKGAVSEAGQGMLGIANQIGDKVGAFLNPDKRQSDVVPQNIKDELRQTPEITTENPDQFTQEHKDSLMQINSNDPHGFFRLQTRISDDIQRGIYKPIDEYINNYYNTQYGDASLPDTPHIETNNPYEYDDSRMEYEY